MNLNVTLGDDNTEKNTVNESLTSNVMALNFSYTVSNANWFFLAKINVWWIKPIRFAGRDAQPEL